MSHEVFTASWAEAWAEEIRRSDKYRKAAATWEGSLVLEAKADAQIGMPEGRAVFLDLWHGRCRDSRVASAEDLASADYVLQADLATWQRVLSGQLEPVLGIMSGQVKLQRGNVAKLAPYVQASREVVAAAGRVDSHFPTQA